MHHNLGDQVTAGATKVNRSLDLERMSGGVLGALVDPACTHTARR